MLNLDRLVRSDNVPPGPGVDSRRAFGASFAAISLLVLLTLTLGACGGSSPGAAPPLTGTAGSNPAGSGTAGVTGGAGTTGAAGMGANVAVCTNYCTTIMANCKGANQQYADMANCMKTCSYMPGGSPTDDGVNSAACRTNAATAAA